MRFIAGFVSAFIVLAVAGLALVFSGVVNIAAREPHSAPVFFLLQTAMRQSVARQAAKVPAPAPSTDIARGFRLYNETCVYCHGAPGKDPTDIGKGLNPEPPFLPDTIQRWNAAEIFWIVKNGVRMTGMPSFADTHSDDDLRAVVAFVQKLPTMTEEQYATYEKAQ
ncbi:cytochrome c [Bosea sp. BIWAKO-01]|uniref:c-type cytochrome n=1 Tax=Bosea sp. BIWAKO-01 TaxID=506668 RepID=UPI00085382E9|nr:cytochrome c [Bosea sp. BIWAKO-01]GAU86128.1 cytochrome c family protein [Bosea sp. BIWAKO-01]